MGEIGPKRVSKELKVENWAPYFLQRLNHLYINSAHCDLTLRFTTADTLKVHRVVLYACTDYFDSVIGSVENNILDLDDSMTPEIISLIVGFMYTGKIDIRPEIREKLYEVALALRMPILTRLIESHRRREGNWHTPPEPATPSFRSIPTKTNPAQTHTRPPELTPATSSTSNDVLKLGLRNDVPTPKRLPIWKRKPTVVTVNPLGLPGRDDGMIRVVLSKPIPTRFEWEAPFGDEFTQAIVGDALRFLSHDANLTCPQPLTLDEGEYAPSPLPALSTPPQSLKRARKSEGSDLNNMKEFGRQQQIRNELMLEEEDVDDPAECSPMSPQIPPKPILKQITRTDSTDSPKRVRFSVGQPESPIRSPARLSTSEIEPKTSAVPNLNVNTTKVAKMDESTSSSGELIMTQLRISGRTAESLKRVRYSVLNSSGAETSVDGVTGSPSVGNPAKIVSEVLKKYPDLVSGRRKNIKLKVMTNNVGMPSAEGLGSPKSTGGKVSYIVVKGAEDSTAEPPTNELNPENVIGPWICTPCGPLQFLGYPDFRQHIVNVHHVKVDSRICEFCGLKMQKRNHLLYHLYTKHGVDPPAPFVFPTCNLCQHVSLSQNLLAKHIEASHMVNKPLVCTVCNVSFKSHMLFGNHELGGCRPSIDRCYRCPYCEKVFGERNSLQDHIVSQHWTTSEKKGMDVSAGKSDAPSHDEVLDDQSSEIDESSQTINEASQSSIEIETMHNLSESECSAGEVKVSDGQETSEETSDSSYVVISQPTDDNIYVENVEEEEPYEQPSDVTYAISQEGVSYEEEIKNKEVTSVYESELPPSEKPAQESQTIVYQPKPEPGDHIEPILVYGEGSDNVANAQQDAAYHDDEKGTSLEAVVYETEPSTEQYQPEQSESYETQADVSQQSLGYSAGEEQAEPEIVYEVDESEEPNDSLVYETEEQLAETYESQGEVSELGMGYKEDGTDACDGSQQELVYETHPDDQTVDYEPEGTSSQGDVSYEGMEVDEGVPTSEDMGTDTEEAPTEGETNDRVAEEGESSTGRGRQGDHDYAPYNSVVMFQPNMVLPQRVMLVTHPIAHPLQVLLSGPNILPDQLVSIPYPQCGTMQVINSGQVVTTTGQVTASVVSECPQVVRERKVEPEALVNDWDENSQAESSTTAPPVVLPGGGPSRPEFF